MNHTGIEIKLLSQLLRAEGRLDPRGAETSQSKTINFYMQKYNFSPYHYFITDILPINLLLLRNQWKLMKLSTTWKDFLPIEYLFFCIGVVVW
jgi:hypothetical protein